MIRRALAVAALALACAPAAVVAEPASAQEPDSATLEVAPRGAVVPPGYSRTTAEVVRAAGAVPAVREERAAHPTAYVRAYLRRPGRWQVAVYVPPAGPGDRSEEVARVVLDDRSGRVLETWTGPQVAWRMARGVPGAFGRAVNAPWIWLGLCLAFVLPFLRRPLRVLHLDLAVLLAFGLSYAWFGAAKLELSVPSAYPLLVYLLGRMVWIAWRRPRPVPLQPLLPPGGLLFGLAFAVAFRLALNVVDGNVIDVGYAGVIGADRVLGGDTPYGTFPADNDHGDTYGPVTYAAYVPWVLVWPWSGTWDDLPAAHAAAVAFDLACVAGMWLAGRRLRGHDFGLLLAYLWVTCPYTLLVANSGANDALVPALVLGAFLLAARPVARGAVAALAGLAKFAPLALVPLFVTAGRGRWISLAAAVATAAAVLAPVALGDGGLERFADRTVRFQAERDSPFSIWGYYGLPDSLQLLATLAAGLFAVAVAFVPRQRDEVTIAALGAAVLIAVQLTAEHWFYLYLVWFLPLLLIALLTPATPGAPARSPWRDRQAPPAPAPR